jgi:hypothetical protein
VFNEIVSVTAENSLRLAMPSRYLHRILFVDLYIFVMHLDKGHAFSHMPKYYQTFSKNIEIDASELCCIALSDRQSYNGTVWYPSHSDCGGKGDILEDPVISNTPLVETFCDFCAMRRVMSRRYRPRASS